MADPRPVLLGGPLDGASISAAQRPAFVFCIEAATINNERRATVFAKPGPGRELYREVERGKFTYAGHTHRQCGDCGAFLKASRKDCPLCGAVAAARC